jgi:integrase
MGRLLSLWFSRTEGKTPAFVDGEVQKLLDAIDASTHTGLRDRALLGVLAYTFARIGAVVNLKVEDYYPSGKRFLLRFKEKDGKEKEMTRPAKRFSLPNSKKGRLPPKSSLQCGCASIQALVLGLRKECSCCKMAAWWHNCWVYPVFAERDLTGTWAL